MKKLNIKHATFLSVAALITIIASTPSSASKRMGEELVQMTKKSLKLKKL